MIEEIKKEIDNLPTTFDFKKPILKCACVNKLQVFEILDKYNNKPDYSDETEKVQYILKHWTHLQTARDYVELDKYQKAWEELNRSFLKLYKEAKTEDDYILLGMSGISAMIEQMQELEQKHNIGVE